LPSEITSIDIPSTTAVFAVAEQKARALARDRRAGATILVAVSMPVLLSALAMGIAVVEWSGVQRGLPRTADPVALAGALADTPSAPVAANAVANVAEMNGAAGATSRSWNGTSQISIDNQITVPVAQGIRRSSDTAVRVIVRQSVPQPFFGIATAATSVTIATLVLADGWRNLVEKRDMLALGRATCFPQQ
jgi:Flp pilus assembly protein TadG